MKIHVFMVWKMLFFLIQYIFRGKHVSVLDHFIGVGPGDRAIGLRDKKPAIARDPRFAPTYRYPDFDDYIYGCFLGDIDLNRH